MTTNKPKRFPSKRPNKELKLQLKCGKYCLKKGYMFCSMPVGPYKCPLHLLRKKEFYTVGWPDMVVILNPKRPKEGKAKRAKVVFIEFKADKFAKVSKQQSVILGKIKKRGHHAKVIYSFKHFVDYLKNVESKR